jgi:hypothetical protein
MLPKNVYLFVSHKREGQIKSESMSDALPLGNASILDEGVIIS